MHLEWVGFNRVHSSPPQWVGQPRVRP
jgi:hypothetical protein